MSWHSITPDQNARDTYACNCIGPQPGFPRCPCQMRGLIQRDGRWIEPEKDLGPVAPKEGRAVENYR